ncbi:hypothetical protein NEOLEDRAFT_1184740 [Neolentinus lepideus HHB14362 ss-1]|uniref:Uncharacterized protein n=1 Tax=Neolentinus lepideus HHB14362 ss-1 TaxID=1314782 RepID=A0A165M6P9_9AGAM|nr:hypothetical protein NEOLEDRAFT_1184740 [Neolentinus lepideus HHB14362 ss-1]
MGVGMGVGMGRMGVGMGRMGVGMGTGIAGIGCDNVARRVHDRGNIVEELSPSHGA